MKRNFITVFILLITLLAVNPVPFYKRATTFTKCIKGSPDLITVKLEPDPLVSGAEHLFTISGTLTKGVITQGSTLKISAMDTNLMVIGSDITRDFCSISGITCPVKVFSFVMNVTVGTLPSTYTIEVAINDPAGATIACVMGVTSN
jgi:hypothetical protein